MTPFRWSRSGQNYIIRRNGKKLVVSISSSMKSFKWLLISWLKERYVCTDLLRLCTKRHYSGDQECELETLSRMTIRPTVDDDFCFSLTSFFHCSKSNEEEDFRKATQLYENTVGVNCEHRTHWTKRGTKGQTSQVIDMQLCRLSISWYWIGCRKRTLLLRSFISGFAALDFTGFARIPMFTMSRKVEIVSFVTTFMGSFSSYELFIIPRLDGAIHNSRFSNSEYSLFIFL